MTRYVLYSEDAGVFLGGYLILEENSGFLLEKSLGFGYWSKWETSEQTDAVTFPNKETALNFIRSLKYSSGYSLLDCRAVPVECASEYASVEECVSAGLPAWGDE